MEHGQQFDHFYEFATKRGSWWYLFYTNAQIEEIVYEDFKKTDTYLNYIEAKTQLIENKFTFTDAIGHDRKYRPCIIININGKEFSIIFDQNAFPSYAFCEILSSYEDDEKDLTYTWIGGEHIRFPNANTMMSELNRIRTKYT